MLPPTIVVDSSAIMAVFFKEPEAQAITEILLFCDPIMATGTRVELDVVAFAKGGASGLREVAMILSNSRVRMEPMDEVQLRWAQEGLVRYGRGRRAPPSALNFGDLFAYALAKAKDLPLLYKGDDFAQTDIRSALAELGAR